MQAGILLETHSNNLRLKLECRKESSRAGCASASLCVCCFYGNKRKLSLHSFFLSVCRGQTKDVRFSKSPSDARASCREPRGALNSSLYVFNTGA